jgi:hypothetical protein
VLTLTPLDRSNGPAYFLWQRVCSSNNNNKVPEHSEQRWISRSDTPAILSMASRRNDPPRLRWLQVKPSLPCFFSPSPLHLPILSGPCQPHHTAKHLVSSFTNPSLQLTISAQVLASAPLKGSRRALMHRAVAGHKNIPGCAMHCSALHTSNKWHSPFQIRPWPAGGFVLHS